MAERSKEKLLDRLYELPFTVLIGVPALFSTFIPLLFKYSDEGFLSRVPPDVVFRVFLTIYFIFPLLFIVLRAYRVDAWWRWIGLTALAGTFLAVGWGADRYGGELAPLVFMAVCSLLTVAAFYGMLSTAPSSSQRETKRNGDPPHAVLEERRRIPDPQALRAALRRPEAEAAAAQWGSSALRRTTTALGALAVIGLVVLLYPWRGTHYAFVDLRQAVDSARADVDAAVGVRSLLLDQTARARSGQLREITLHPELPSLLNAIDGAISKREDTIPKIVAGRTGAGGGTRDFLRTMLLPEKNAWWQADLAVPARLDTLDSLYADLRSLIQTRDPTSRSDSLALQLQDRLLPLYRSVRDSLHVHPSAEPPANSLSLDRLPLNERVRQIEQWRLVRAMLDSWEADEATRLRRRLNAQVAGLHRVHQTTHDYAQRRLGGIFQSARAAGLLLFGGGIVVLMLALFLETGPLAGRGSSLPAPRDSRKRRAGVAKDRRHRARREQRKAEAAEAEAHRRESYLLGIALLTVLIVPLWPPIKPESIDAARPLRSFTSPHWYLPSFITSEVLGRPVGISVQEPEPEAVRGRSAEDRKEMREELKSIDTRFTEIKAEMSTTRLKLEDWQTGLDALTKAQKGEIEALRRQLNTALPADMAQ